MARPLPHPACGGGWQARPPPSHVLLLPPGIPAGGCSPGCLPGASTKTLPTCLLLRLRAAPPLPPSRRSEELQLPHLVAFSRLALARFQLLHPHQPAPGEGGGAAGSSGGAASASSADQQCSSSLAVAGALRDVTHLHMATRLAAAAPQAPPSASTSAAARVLRGVGDLFTSTATLFGPSMQGGLQQKGGCAAA